MIRKKNTGRKGVVKLNVILGIAVIIVILYVLFNDNEPW